MIDFQIRSDAEVPRRRRGDHVTRKTRWWMAAVREFLFPGRGQRTKYSRHALIRMNKNKSKARGFRRCCDNYALPRMEQIITQLKELSKRRGLIYARVGYERNNVQPGEELSHHPARGGDQTNALQSWWWDSGKSSSRSASVPEPPSILLNETYLNGAVEEAVVLSRTVEQSFSVGELPRVSRSLVAVVAGAHLFHVQLA